MGKYFKIESYASRFIVVNTMLLSIVCVALWANFFAGFFILNKMEYAMIGFLFVYFLFGVIAAWRENWEVTRHIANGLPMWALTFTGIGIVNAAIGLTGTDTNTLLMVFKNLALAISPNIVGVFLMVWLREIALWCGNEET